MKKYTLAATFFAVALMNMASPAWSADQTSDAALVQRQTRAIPKLRELAAGAGGYKNAEVTVTAAVHQITIVAIEKNAAKETPATREVRASVMISAVENEIDGKPEFAQVMVIHVNFVGRAGKGAPTIQSVDFFKGPSGGFVLHRT
jgi:hypothetical protein